MKLSLKAEANTLRLTCEDQNFTVDVFGLHFEILCCKECKLFT